MLASAARLGGRELATEAALAAFTEHAVRDYPKECVGFLLASGDYRPVRNTSEDPTRSSVPDRAELAAVLRDGSLRAFCHSHPDAPACPSAQDMRTQIELEVPFIIVSTNGEACLPPFAFGDELDNRAPLIGRPFRHAVTDCYELIRDHRLQVHGESLPSFPRDWEWWDPAYEGETDLYRRHFADAGYREVDSSDAMPSDVWLAQVGRTSTPNHAGIYLGGGLALHHASSRLPFDPSRLAKREPVARWQPFITHWLRRG